MANELHIVVVEHIQHKTLGSAYVPVMYALQVETVLDAGYEFNLQPRWVRRGSYRDLTDTDFEKVRRFAVEVAFLGDLRFVATDVTQAPATELPVEPAAPVAKKPKITRVKRA